jgi:hypothetical protein
LCLYHVDRQCRQSLFPGPLSLREIVHLALDHQATATRDKCQRVLVRICIVFIIRPDLHKVSRRHFDLTELDAAGQEKDLFDPLMTMKWESSAGLELGEIGALAVFLPDRGSAETRNPGFRELSRFFSNVDHYHTNEREPAKRFAAVKASPLRTSRMAESRVLDHLPVDIKERGGPRLRRGHRDR